MYPYQWSLLIYRPLPYPLRSLTYCLIFVTGKHEERDTDSKKVTIRQFQRMYTLPEGVTKEDVVSNLSADGVLVVTAKKGAAKQ